MKTSFQESHRVLHTIGRRLLLLRGIPSQIRLARTKSSQKKSFYALRSSFSEVYDAIKRHNIDQFMMPIWKDFNKEIEKAFSPYPPFSFLRNRIIEQTMFVGYAEWSKKELSFLERRIPRNELRTILQEDYVGNPFLLDSTYLTSHNSIHHLYHLVRFLDRTQCDLDEIDTVVEWGGGYGNMAKIFGRLESTPSTYVIIDTPLFSAVQWLYLATILGEDSVNILQDPSDSIQIRKINLIPLCFLDLHSISGDLFISTWALSESSRFSQDYVITRNWFDSRHILLAFADSKSILPEGDRIGKIVMDTGAHIDDIEFLPGNHYAFR